MPPSNGYVLRLDCNGPKENAILGEKLSDTAGDLRGAPAV
jgi:hypothetical protein